MFKINTWCVCVCVTVATYASSSCFILVYSSLVMVASPSPSLCIFSLGLSKSGFGGAGGIYRNREHRHIRKQTSTVYMKAFVSFKRGTSQDFKLHSHFDGEMTHYGVNKASVGPLWPHCKLTAFARHLCHLAEEQNRK